jgi:hypothetical protein
MLRHPSPSWPSIDQIMIGWRGLKKYREDILTEETSNETQTSGTVSDATVQMVDPLVAKEVFDAFDSLRRLNLQIGLDLFEKTFNLITQGTGLYEKLILVNGAAIALSITFLGSLSSHTAMDHIQSRPPLWMIDIAWALLILSIYLSYRVIIERHSATVSVLRKVSISHSKYQYDRLELILIQLSRILAGKLTVGDKKVDIQALFLTFAEALKKEGEAKVKESSDLADAALKESKERPLARLAIWCTLIAVVILCIFTARTMSLLF